MSGWVEFGKLCGAFMSGAGLIWLREWLAENAERKRKQRALWRACAVEAEAASAEFAQVQWMKGMLEKGNAPVTVVNVNPAASRLAERLIELDAANIEVYLAFIQRTNQLAQKAEDVRKQSTAHVVSADALAHRALLFAEVVHMARIGMRQMAARLRVLRTLRSLIDDDKASSVISRAEHDSRVIGEMVDQWERTYAAIIGIEQDLDALRAIRPTS